MRFGGVLVFGSRGQIQTLTVHLVYKIEKILEEKGRGKNKQYLVKWLNFDTKHNSWIPAKNIEI